MLQDIAILTGGTAISEDLGIKLDQVKLDMLGKAKKVMIERENTTIVNGAGGAVRHMVIEWQGFAAERGRPPPRRHRERLPLRPLSRSGAEL